MKIKKILVTGTIVALLVGLAGTGSALVLMREKVRALEQERAQLAQKMKEKAAQARTRSVPKKKKQAAKAWLRQQLTKPIARTMETLAAVVRGHCNYYGVSGNFKQIQKFWKYLKYETYRMLNRRDQKGKLRYPKFLRIWNFYVEEPKLKVDIWGWKPKTV